MSAHARLALTAPDNIAARRAGFTILELSIAVVIIALVVGGLVFGQDLITAARIRAQVSQLEATSAAVAAFQMKYLALPGDLSTQDAAALGFVARSGEAGHGDENGLVESCEQACSGLCTIVPLGCEVVLFWSDLSLAHLTNGSFSEAVDDYVQASAYKDTLEYFPEAGIGGSTLHATTCARSELWLVAIRIKRSTLTDGGGTATQVANVRAGDAYRIDAKLDDGLARSGSVRANDTGGSAAEGYYCDVPDGSSTCVNAQGEYDSAADSGLCQLNYRVATQ